MKPLHRPDLFCWSKFDEGRNLDFNGYVWIRPTGNVLVDPLAMIPHDLKHLESLGGASWVVITNSDHVRGSKELATHFGAKIAGPVGEREAFPFQCDRWLGERDEVVPGMRVLELHGSKTPGELMLLIEGTTLITGDLIRGQRAGRLNLLPEDKLKDPTRAIASATRLLDHSTINAVLVGDGWSAFNDGYARLEELFSHI